MSERAVVLVSDMDGVVCNIMGVVTHAIYRTFGVEVTPDMCRSYYTARWFYPALKEHFRSEDELATWLERRIWHNPYAYAAAEPYAEVLRAYHAFTAAGGDLRLVTSRPACVGPATRLWAETVDLPRPRLTGRDAGKVQLAERLCARRTVRSTLLFLDDNIAAVTLAAKRFQRLEGIAVAACMTRPWNECAEARRVVDLDVVLASLLTAESVEDIRGLATY